LPSLGEWETGSLACLSCLDLRDSFVEELRGLFRSLAGHDHGFHDRVEQGLELARRRVGVGVGSRREQIVDEHDRARGHQRLLNATVA
jgi:hypothetical protein